MDKKEKTFEELLAETDAEMAELTRRNDATNLKVKQLAEEGRQEQAQFDQNMHDIARGKKPKTTTVIQEFEALSAEADVLMKRSDELGASQQRLLDEMAANPLEEQCDAVYAKMGQQFYALAQEERDEAIEANRYLTADEEGDVAEEELERSGQPPPLRLVR